MGSEAYAEYLAAITDPGTVNAMLEDYRAGTRDRLRRRARRVLWSAHDDLADLYGDPLAVGESWTDDLEGRSIDSGHHMAEDAPQELTRALARFVGRTQRGRGSRSI